MTAPVIHAGSPEQRALSSLVDVPYKGYSAASNPCSLVAVEYSLTGAFAGEELPCTPKVTDPTHDGYSQLAFIPAGADLNFVWDAGSDLGVGVVSDVAQVRMRAAEGLDLSTYSTSAQFLVDTRESDTDELVHYSRGQTISLRVSLIDREGEPINPEDLELVSVLDPYGTEMLYSPVVAEKVDEGLWSAEFDVPSDAELGTWEATWEYTLEETTSTRLVSFIVDSGIEAYDPIGEETCVVRGRLFRADGTPLVGATVSFLPHHLSDPELGNVTDISEDAVTIVTDSMGRFVVELIKNTEGIIWIESLGFKQFVKVPDADTSEFRPMMVELPTGDRDKFGNRLPEGS